MSAYDPDTLSVGVLGRPHGVRGDLHFRPHNPSSRAFDHIREVWLVRDGRSQRYDVAVMRPVADGYLTRLVGVDTTTEHAETAGASGKLLTWLRINGPASKTAMKRAGFGWEAVETHLGTLLKAGKVDAGPGRKAGTSLYFAVNESSS